MDNVSYFVLDPVKTDVFITIVNKVKNFNTILMKKYKKSVIKISCFFSFKCLKTNVFKTFVNIHICSNILAVQFLVGLANFSISGIRLRTAYLVDIKNFLLKI